MTDQLPQKFLTTPIPANETERLAVLHRYKILDTPPEVAFDRITTLAARLFNMPIALISLVDESRAWFKSCIGFDAKEVPRDVMLCSFSVLTEDPLIIPDTRLDERFACNPIIQSEPGVRFYAGAPLLSRDGFNLGTLCLLDTQPHEALSAEQQATLVDLAAMVVDELELRLAADKVAQSDSKYRRLFESIDEGFCVVEILLDAQNTPINYRVLEVNSTFEQQTGLQQAVGKTARQLNLEEHWIEIYGQVALTGESVRFENGSKTLNRWFDVYACRTGEPEARKVAIVFKDISDRKQALEISRRTAKMDAFRVSLADALRPLADSAEIQSTASRVLGEYLGANRVAYFEVRGADYVVERDYVNGAKAIAGRYPVDSFGPKLLWAYRTGHTVSVSDVEADPHLSLEQHSAYAAVQVGAYIGIPLVKKGEFVAGLSIHTAGARDWTSEEVSLAEEVAERTWGAVERARAESALRQSEARFRTLISASSNVLYRMNADWSEMHELQGGNFIADTSEPRRDWLQKYIHPDDQERVLLTIAEVIQNKHLFELEHRVRQADGTLGWTYSRAVPLLDSFGEIVEWFGEASDISDRKRIEQEREQILRREQTAREAAERANHERKAQLQQATEFGAMLGRVIDKVRESLDETQILQTVVKELALVLNVSCCNTAVYDLEQGTSTIYYEYALKAPGAQKRTTQIAADSGVYQQLLQGQYSQFCSLTPNPIRGRVAMLACPIFDDRGVLGDLWLTNQSNYFFNELEIRLVQQVANQCAIAIRQARLYQVAIAQIDELERLNQLKDDFLSTVSHELRTPIANMKMAIAMLKVAPNSEKQERYLNILQAECARESEMIDDLLDLQRLELEFCTNSLSEAINLQEMLPKIIEPFYVRAGQRQQTLQLDLPLELPAIVCNHVSLERIIVELINNACKYTGAGGDIVLGIRYEPTQIATIFTISNSAEIPQAQLPRIFDKFYRVPQADRWQQGGTGLGLALIQKLVEQMQGNISVVCSNGWTSFTVKLPNQIKTS